MTIIHTAPRTQYQTFAPHSHHLMRSSNLLSNQYASQLLTDSHPEMERDSISRITASSFPGRQTTRTTSLQRQEDLRCGGRYRNGHTATEGPQTYPHFQEQTSGM